MVSKTPWIFLSCAALAAGGLGYLYGTRQPAPAAKSAKMLVAGRQEGDAASATTSTQPKPTLLALPLMPRITLKQVLATPDREWYRALLGFLPEASAAEIGQLVAAKKQHFLDPFDYDWWNLVYQRWTVVDAAAAEALASQEPSLASVLSSTLLAADPSQFERLLAMPGAQSDSHLASLVAAQIDHLMQVDPQEAAGLFRRWRNDPRALDYGMAAVLHAIVKTSPELAMALVREDASKTLQADLLAKLFRGFSNDPADQAKQAKLFGQLSKEEQAAAIPDLFAMVGDAELSENLERLVPLARDAKLKETAICTGKVPPWLT